MASNFEDYMEELSPPWLLTGQGVTVMRAIGQMKDNLVWRSLQGMMTKYPSYGTASAVGLIGAERGIDRAAGETLESYAGRVRAAWATRFYGGTAAGLLSTLVGAGYVNVRLAIRSRRIYWMDGGVPQWQSLPEESWKFRNLGDTYWNRFIVLFPEPLPADWVSGGVPDEDSDEAEVIRVLVNRWKPAHMDCEGYLIATSPETFDYFPEGGTWDDPGATWGDETTWTYWSP